MRTRIPVIAILLVCLVAPTAVPAKQPVVPTDVSGADQYTETLPGAEGNEETGTIQHPRNPTDGIGRSNATGLESLGEEGRAAAELAAAGAPDDGTRAGDRHGEGQNENAQPAPSGDGSGSATQVVGDLAGTSDSGGMGVLLPILIAAIAAAVAAFAFSRRQAAQKHN